MQVIKGIMLIWAIGKLRLHTVFKFDSVFFFITDVRGKDKSFRASVEVCCIFTF